MLRYRIVNKTLTPFFAVRIRQRYSRQKRLGVRMQRMPEKLVTAGKLYDLAEVHHGDAVRKILYHGKIVCNEQDGKSEAVAQLVKKIYDLRLN